MKRICLIIFLCCSQLGWGQIPIPVPVPNIDLLTQGKLGLLIVQMAAKSTSQIRINTTLGMALASLQGQLLQDYTPNPFDAQSAFLASALSSAALSLGTTVISNNPNLPYMTSEKEDYIQGTTMDKGVLAGLQVVNPVTIKSGKRQEIYRLRTALLRTLSRQDREARSALMFSVMAQMITKPEKALELWKYLKAVNLL